MWLEAVHSAREAEKGSVCWRAASGERRTALCLVEQTKAVESSAVASGVCLLLPSVGDAV